MPAIKNDPEEPIKVKRINIDFVKKMYPINMGQKQKIEETILRMLRQKGINTENIRVSFKYYSK